MKPPVLQPAPGPRRRHSNRGWLVPLADRRQRVIIGLFGAVWLVAALRFVRWWIQPEHRVGMFGFVATSAVIGFTLLLPLWLFFTAFNAQRPRADLTFGFGRVAMIVTKAPAEPWILVRTTIRAMLDQDYEHGYDVWLADENPSDETLQWCADNGVRVSSRHNIAAYHQPDWPRRTKSKEGNLSFFYDHWGYRDYDIVCQFDADHVPQRDYLRTILRGFANPNVGYVAAPSICSAGSERSWTSRGRLHKEAPLHGLLQAGHNRGFAPTCVGSHYAVRTQAVKEIGGIGPELAEDFSTSFLLAAHGWVGVFDIEAIAVGEGPMTFLDGMTQELQWARSLTTVALRYSGGHWSNLAGTERFRFGFIQLWYPLFVGHLFLGSVLAPIAALTGRPWMALTIVEFFTRVSLPTMVLVAFMLWVRRQRWLRPQDSPVLSWESALFNITRWPWNALGIGQAVMGAIRSKTYSFRVTPKGGSDHQPMPWTALAPYSLLVALQAAVVFTANLNSNAFGYVIFTNTGALIYAIATVAVLALHLRENRTGALGDRLAANAPALILTMATASIAFASSIRTIRFVLEGWVSLGVSNRLLGLDHLTSPATLIYVLGITMLVGAVKWDRRPAAPVIAATRPAPIPPQHRQPASRPVRTSRPVRAPQPVRAIRPVRAPQPVPFRASAEDRTLVTLSEAIARQQVAGISHLGGRQSVDLLDLDLLHPLGTN